jgi:hypothetical protein
MNKVKNVIIQPLGDVDLIESKHLCLLEAAELLGVNFNRDDKNYSYQSQTGDMNSWEGQKDTLYKLDGYSTGACTYIIMPYGATEENLLAKEVLGREYNIKYVKATGPMIILRNDRTAKDLVYFIERQQAKRRNHITKDEYLSIRTKHQLLNYTNYVNFVLEHPEMNLPIRPDFHYNIRINKH